MSQASEQMQQNVREMHNRTLAEVTRLARQPNECTLLVLDELCAALSLGLIDRDAVLAAGQPR